MAAAVHRAATALGFPILYTQGFQPHPRVSFGPPLPFAVLGKAEGFDMMTGERLQIDPLILNTMLPPDLRVLSCRPVAEHAPSLSSSIVAATYRIEPIGDTPDAESMRLAVGNAVAQTSLPVTVIRDGKAKIKELRPLILGLTFTDRTVPGIEALLSLEPGKTCKPAELIEALFPGTAFSGFMIVRTECFLRNAGRLEPLSG
jgi:radical SAM-linked protein